MILSEADSFDGILPPLLIGPPQPRGPKCLKPRCPIRQKPDLYFSFDANALGDLTDGNHEQEQMW